MNMHDENIVQGKVLKILPGDVIDNIWKYGGLFREILQEFNAESKPCTPDDLIFIASEKLHYNIRL